MDLHLETMKIVAAFAGLIQMKRVAGRMQDLADIETLQRERNDG